MLLELEQLSMAQQLPVVLYVDGACKGNPGVGGWGVYIENSDGSEESFFGGEAHTTNNRMELMAAIKGLEHTPVDKNVIIWTDSNYVQKGISEWIKGWKKKNWRKSDGGAVVNTDLWQRLDTLCQGRKLDWRWIKGHAGHAGNERADQLANQGVAFVLQSGRSPRTSSSSQGDAKSQTIDPLPASVLDLDQPFTTLSRVTMMTLDNTSHANSSHSLKKEQPDWLDDDPLGFGLDVVPEESFNGYTEALFSEQQSDVEDDAQDLDRVTGVNNVTLEIPVSKDITKRGKRYLILDTETTGFYADAGDRIVEIGAIEMIDRKLTGNTLHLYINPKREVGDSANIHGLTDAFLADKPLFKDVADEINAFIADAGIIAHNAKFDMAFLEMEFAKAKLPPLAGRVEVIDSLLLAKQKHPTQKNSLDALAKRYDVKARDRTFHGALLDAEILADVYLAMTGGQVALLIDEASTSRDEVHVHKPIHVAGNRPIVIYASSEELEIQNQWIDDKNKKRTDVAAWMHLAANR